MKELLEKMKTSLPKYNLRQPSTGKIISYRPFTVKEEKILLMSNTTGSYEDFLATLTDIIDRCFDLPITSKKLPIFDVEYFFLKLRAKSINETVEPTITCPSTNQKVKLLINLDEIEPITNSEHTNVIDLNTVVVTMKYPSVETIINSQGKGSDYFEMLLDCIKTIETDKELIETENYPRSDLTEFVELLTDTQYKKLINFIKTMPRLEKTVNYRTTDGIERQLLLKGLKNFFL